MFFAPARNRFFAFLIDFFIVYIFRVIYFNLSIKLFLKEQILDFAKKYESLYGKFDVNNITQAETIFFLQSNLFKILIVFFVFLFLIASVYNIICICTKWSSTIGQKIFHIHIVSSDGKKLNVYQIIARSILIVVPWAFMFILSILMSVNVLNLNNVFDKNLLLISGFAFISWYDMIFFTKDKILFHDLISKTRVVVDNPEKYMDTKQYNFLKFLFPDFKGMYTDLKDVISEQIAKAKELKEEYRKRRNK